MYLDREGEYSNYMVTDLPFNPFNSPAPTGRGSYSQGRIVGASGRLGRGGRVCLGLTLIPGASPPFSTGIPPFSCGTRE